MKRLVILVFCLVICGSTSSNAQSLKRLQVDSMTGISDLCVVVEYLSPEAERDGLERAALQSAVELRLRQVGIKVLREGEMQKTVGSPYLYININVKEYTGSGLAYFNIDVELVQNANLARRPEILMPLTTWRRGKTGAIGVRRLADLRQSVLEYVDFFANDFLSVNKTN